MAQFLQAGDFATEGERQAAAVLRTLPNDWTVIANKVLVAGAHRSFEIDFIVVGTHRVFVIDEKGWSGPIHGSDQSWVRADGSSEQSPLNKVDYVAKVLAGYLRARVGSLPQDTHFVEGCVLLSQVTVRPQIRDPRARDGILLLDDSVKMLTARDAEAGVALPPSARERMGRVLFDLSDRPKIPRAIGPYQIQEVTGGPHGSYVLGATHEQGGQRSLALYKVAGADDDLQRFHLREYEALARLLSTGVAPDVLDPFTWSEDYLVVPSYLPSGTPLRALRHAAGRDAAGRELALAAAAFHALAKVHAEGIVHRALSPDSVYVRDGTPPGVLFSGFFAARAGGETVAPKLDELRRVDPYAAPEIALGYGMAEETSDVYSLALVFLERLSGVPIGQLVQPEEKAVRMPSVDTGWSHLPQELVEHLLPVFERALRPGPMAPQGTADAQRPSASLCATRLDELAREARLDAEIAFQRLLDGRYRVERVLGTGASARTLLATDTEADGLFVLKQFLRPDTLAESREARREFEALRGITTCPNLPRVFDIYPTGHDVQVKLEYVEGTTLAGLMDTFVGRLDRWLRLATDLLGAVEHLERRHLLHRDVKPDNVIIRDDTGAAVLIDFGLATSLGTVDPVAGTPRYLPPEAFSADAPPPSSDRYALGVLLFRALSGRLPFAEADGARTQQRLLPLAEVAEELRPYAEVLLRAVHPLPDERPQSAVALRDALLAAQPPQPGSDDLPRSHQINPWVDLVRGLFRNSRGGNADNRGLDSDFARDTYVPTALDERLLPAILRDRPRVVFLSGNPGDGKTAFLERVQDALREGGARRTSAPDDRSGWEWELGGHAFRACYDASEASGARSADQQLAHRLRGLGGASAPEIAVTVLVAINDGRLADFLERQRPDFAWLPGAVDGARRDGDGGAVWLVDLKRRSYVAPDGDRPSVLRRLVGQLVASDRWAPCSSCAARDDCPIYRNSGALAAAGPESPAARLEHALLLAHLRGERHLTVRDIRSGLAFAITADLGCADVHARRARNLPMRAESYWQTAFTTTSQRDVMLGELRALDPAREARPRLERLLFFHQHPDEAPLRAALFADGTDLPPLTDIGEWLAQAKRRLYFESPEHTDAGTGGDAARDTPLPYRHATRFLAALGGGVPAGDLLPLLLRGIGRSDGISGQVLEGHLCLRVAHSEAQGMTVLKRFPLAEFALEVSRAPDSAYLETMPDALVLRHPPSRGRLAISLDLFELLLRLAEGLGPASPEYRALLEDLVPFKSVVQRQSSRDLILVEGTRRLHQLTQENGQLIGKPVG